MNYVHFRRFRPCCRGLSKLSRPIGRVKASISTLKQSESLCHHPAESNTGTSTYISTSKYDIPFPTERFATVRHTIFRAVAWLGSCVSSTAPTLRLHAHLSAFHTGHSNGCTAVCRALEIDTYSPSSNCFWVLAGTGE